MDVFYIQIFQEIFGENLGLQPGETPEQMAENIDALLNMIEDALPEINIETLNGDMIVEGDFQQIIMMLELISELIVMIDHEGEEDEDDPEQAKLLQLQQLQAQDELKKQQEELMRQNNENSKAIRPNEGKIAYRDPRDILKERKKGRQGGADASNNQSTNNSAKKPGAPGAPAGPIQNQKQAPQSKNPLDQFAANNANKDPLSQFAGQQNAKAQNQFGANNQRLANQFGGGKATPGTNPQLNQFKSNNPQLNQFGGNPQLNQFGGNPAMNQFNPGGSNGFVPFGQVSNVGMFGGNMGIQPFGSGDPLAAPSGFGAFMPGQAPGMGMGGDAYAFDINLDVPKEIKIPPKFETEQEEEEDESESESEINKNTKVEKPQDDDELDIDSQKLIDKMLDEDDKPHVWGENADEVVDIVDDESGDPEYSDNFEATVSESQSKQLPYPQKSPQKSKEITKKELEFESKLQKQKEAMDNTDSFIVPDSKSDVSRTASNINNSKESIPSKVNKSKLINDISQEIQKPQVAAAPNRPKRVDYEEAEELESLDDEMTDRDPYPKQPPAQIVQPKKESPKVSNFFTFKYFYNFSTVND